MILVLMAYVVTYKSWFTTDQRRGLKRRSFDDFRRAPGISTLLLVCQLSFVVVFVTVGVSMMTTWEPWQVMLLATLYGLLVLVLALVYNRKASQQSRQRRALFSAVSKDDTL